jgi:hypothetical protein
MLPVLASQALSFAFSGAVRLRFRGRSLLTKDDSFPISGRLRGTSVFLAGSDLVKFRIVAINTDDPPAAFHGVFVSSRSTRRGRGFHWRNGIDSPHEQPHRENPPLAADR